MSCLPASGEGESGQSPDSGSRDASLAGSQGRALSLRRACITLKITRASLLLIQGFCVSRNFYFNKKPEYCTVG